MPRQKTRYIHVENKNALLELLTAGTPFHKIFVASNAFRDPKTKKIMELAHRKNIPVERVTRKRLNRLSRSATCESIIGLKPAPEAVTLEDLLRIAHENTVPIFILILNDIHYTQNIGALLRTAYGSGVDAVIISKRKNSYLTEDVTRISMGASERIPVIQMSIFDAIKQLKDAGVSIVGVHMEGSPYFEEDLRGDIALVVGSEDRGISQRVLEKCDKTVSIPMTEDLQSLNVSAAGAVVMYEKMRQDKQKIKSP